MHAQFLKNHEKVPEMVLVRRQGFKKHDFRAKWVPKVSQKEVKGIQKGARGSPKVPNGSPK